MSVQSPQAQTAFAVLESAVCHNDDAKVLSDGQLQEIKAKSHLPL
jgi:hypothetical protein